MIQSSSADIMSRGMQCLTRHMGVVDAERFISLVIRERFDYEKWQKDYFDVKTPEEISSEASQFENEHPFQGDALVL